LARAPQPTVCFEFLVLDDMLDGPGAAVVDVLRLVNELAAARGARRAPLSWQWRRADGRKVYRVPAPSHRSDVPDVLVVPGWHARNGPHLDRLVQRDQVACARLQAVLRGGGQVIAFYTGVALLAHARLLDARRAVVPWPFIAATLRHAPQLQLAEGPAWAVDDRVWSADSPALATELALQLLQACGLVDLAQAARAVCMHTPERQQLGKAVAQLNTRRAGPGAVERARRWLDDNLQSPYSLAATAEAAAISPRSLLRHFRAAFGQTPLQLLHGLRITRARMLLETSYLPVEAIAEHCGWHDVAMLRRAFRRATGTTPAAYRDRYRLRTERRRWGRDLPSGVGRRDD
jgi:transcriptional regulator GlxA family with amidase domain